MAQAEQAALRKMTVAETKLKVAVKDLNDKCDGDNGINPSELWVTRKIATLANYWSGFEKAHTSYVELLDLEASVEAFEHFGVVTQLHDDVVEKGKALIDSRQAPTPRRATIQEQYDVAAHERQTTFEEVEGIVAEVVSHVEEKGEETPASLQRQKEKLARAEELLKVAHVFTTTMAELNPEHAERDLGADRVKKIEVMGAIRKQMDALSLLATPAPAASTTAAGRDAGYMYERRKLPSFGGARRDYPSFRREWQTNVSGKFSAEYELREIKQNTPVAVEADLKNLKAMKDVWDFLDRKYGRTMELASELISGLQNFKPSSRAKSESACFAELDREWTKVYNDLQEVGKLDVLNHEPTLRGFAQKLPSAEVKKAYIALRIKMLEECEDATPPTVLSELVVMEKFMRAERHRQELFEGLVDEKEVKPREFKQLDWRDNNCVQCGKSGHKKADCPGLGGGRSYSTSHQVPSNSCPACNQQHTFVNREGYEVPCTRLGAVCSVFSNLDVSERVAVLEDANGCANCLDFTGRHQRDQCWARSRDGQPFTCTEKVNGVQCGKKHHFMLHGSTSKFSCYVRVNRAYVSAASTVPTVPVPAVKEEAVEEVRVLPEQWEGPKARPAFPCSMKHKARQEKGKEVEQERRGEKRSAGAPLSNPPPAPPKPVLEEKSEETESLEELDDEAGSEARAIDELAEDRRENEEDLEAKESQMPAVQESLRDFMRREPEELTMIEENIELNVERQEVTLHYPLNKGPKLLGDNRHSAEARAKSPEQSLPRQGSIEAYNQEIKAFVDGGTFVQLSREEMAGWTCQDKSVNYISHHPVVKAHPVTTKLWDVSNSSLIYNQENGLSYNNLLPKVGWRSYQHCTEWYLTKAFNTVKTFEDERPLWRCTTTSLKVAEAEAAEMIKKGIGGGPKDDVYRLILTESNMVPLTVNQLFLGLSLPSEDKVMEEEEEFRARFGFDANFFKTWWSLCKQQGFASLLMCNKLEEERRHKNLREGDDVFLLLYENKVKNTYRLCRVKEVKVSEDGLARTVTIVYKAKKGKELPYVSVPLSTMASPSRGWCCLCQARPWRPRRIRRFGWRVEKN